MSSKQSKVSTSWFSDVYPPLEIQMTIQINIPGEPLVDVSIGLSFASNIPENLQENIHQRLYNGVHSGLAYEGIPSGGIIVDILELDITPFPDSPQESKEINRLGNLIEGLTTELVADLWSAVKILNSDGSS